MKKLAFRITANGADSASAWIDIKDRHAKTIFDGDVIEYAYGPPVVTDEMARRFLEADGITKPNPQTIAGTVLSLRAALEPVNG